MPNEARVREAGDDRRRAGRGSAWPPAGAISPPPPAVASAFAVADALAGGRAFVARCAWLLALAACGSSPPPSASRVTAPDESDLASPLAIVSRTMHAAPSLALKSANVDWGALDAASRSSGASSNGTLPSNSASPWSGASANVAPPSNGATTSPAPASAAPASGEAPRAALVRLLVAGDVLPHRPRLSSPERIAAALAPMGPLFRQADLVVANYETATGDPEALGDRRLVYAATQGWMGAVRGAKIGALTLANNHACDLGATGLKRSIAAADALGEIGLGASDDDDGPWAPRTLVERDGRRVCGIAWTTFVNEARSSCRRRGMLAVAPLGRRGEAQVARAVSAARAGGCDAVVAIFHGGLEYVPQIRPVNAQALAAADAGADAVIIHHPHVASPVYVAATRDGRRVPIFASVGNLVSNQGESWKPAYPAAQKDRHIVYMNGWTRLGVVADLAFAWPAAAPSRAELSWGYHLVWTENGHADDKADPMPRVAVRPVDRAADRDVLAKLAKDASGPAALFADPCWVEGEDAAPRCR